MIACLPGEQGEHGQGDEVLVGARPSGQAEGHLQRGALTLRQVPRAVQKRRDQAVQPGKREIRFGLHTSDRKPSQVRGAGGIADQGGLTHTRFTAQHQGPAHPVPGRVKGSVYRAPFCLTAEKEGGVPRVGRAGARPDHDRGPGGAARRPRRVLA